MIKKTYIAYGVQLHTQVRVPGKGCADLKFTPYSNYESGRGGSIFETSDEELQAAMENDYRFGSLYCLKSVNGMDPYEWEEYLAAKADETSEEATEKEDSKPGYIHVPVDNIMDAKSYLIDNYKWEPKGRQTKSSIKAVAESYGVIFEGI